MTVRFVQRHPDTGAVQFDTEAGDKVAVILGTFLIDYQSNPDGSFNVPQLAGARPFGFIKGTGYMGVPVISFSGTTLTWQRTRNGFAGYPATGQFQAIYGGIELETLAGASPPYLNLRSPSTGKIIFTSRFALFQYLGTAARQATAGQPYQHLDSSSIRWSMGGSTALRFIAIVPSPDSVAMMGSFSDGIAIATPQGTVARDTHLVFDRTALLATGAAGLNTRNPVTGELTWSSAQQTMRAVDVIEVATGDSSTWVGTSGRVYAAIFSGPIGYSTDDETTVTMEGGNIVIGPDPPYYQFSGYSLGVRTDGNSRHVLVFDWLRHSGDNYGVKRERQPDNNFGGKVIIVDVTGMV